MPTVIISPESLPVNLNTLMDSENEELLAVVILLLPRLEAEIQMFPVWWLPSWKYQLPVVSGGNTDSFNEPLNGWTQKMVV